MYKTISYPKHESGTDEIERLRLVIANGGASEFTNWLERLNSQELRLILGTDYKSLHEESKYRNLPMSDMAITKLKKHFNSLSDSSNGQISLFGEGQQLLGKHGTFSPNLIESIHRWYPYIEGFSSTFVETLINKWSEGAKSIFDPFAGTGTTLTVGAINNIKGFYSEINPFMQLVINCKTNHLKRIVLNNEQSQLRDYFTHIIEFAEKNQVSQESAEDTLNKTFPGRPFFVNSRLVQIVSLKNAVFKVEPSKEYFRDMARLALGSIGVLSSEMKRASDLRYRREKELLPESFNVFDQFKEKVAQIINDLSGNLSDMTPTQFVGSNALHKNELENEIDLIITSPPYLNGTNYFRNTKIELWLTGLIQHEKELVQFNREAMIAGINNVSKKSRPIKKFDFVEEVATKLDEVAYDKRIPTLVRGYCSDSEMWIENCKRMLSDGGKLVIDIGDSKFAGIHVPTDKFLIEIAGKVGLQHIDTELVRKRNSNDGTELKQVLLAFEKRVKVRRSSSKNRSDIIDDYKRNIQKFASLPYKNTPYGSRNWGHSLHSLCSYQGKLKPAIAHFLVKYFTKEGDHVLDPMSGSGTIPLEAFLNRRIAFAGDLQRLGFILSRAKVGKPNPDLVLKEADNLIKYIKQNKKNVKIHEYDDFGFNGKIPEYFHPDTLVEVLVARSYLKQKKCDSVERGLVFSSLLHILHGNRPYALSRRSHPVTPFKPRGEYEYRDIESRLYAKLARSLDSYEHEEYFPGNAYRSPFEKLTFNEEIDSIITSPPFTASTRFYSSNWMRLWMSGWEPEEFKSKPKDFLEEKQKKSLDIYYDFFERSNNWLKPNGKLILHLGKTKKTDMAAELMERCGKYFEVVDKFDEDVAGREKFGIKDQGATSVHQYLFLIKK